MRIPSLLGSLALAVTVLGTVTGVSALAATEETDLGSADAAAVRLTIQGLAVANNAAAEFAVELDSLGEAKTWSLEVVDAARAESPLYQASGHEHISPLYKGELRANGSGGMATGRRSFIARFTADGVQTDSEPVGVQVHFWDTPPGHPFYEEILWFGGADLTKGYADLGFHPGDALSRDAVAAFLHRTHVPADRVLPCRVAPFRDVPISHPFCSAISWLKDRGITTGYTDGTFRPSAPIDRQAVAVMLYRAGNPGAVAPRCTSAPFRDVAPNSTTCGEIAWLTQNKIVAGYDDGTFRGGQPVSRAAYAAFAYRLDNLTGIN